MDTKGAPREAFEIQRYRRTLAFLNELSFAARQKARRRSELGVAIEPKTHREESPAARELRLSIDAALERHRRYNAGRPAHERVTENRKAIARIIRGGPGRFIREDGSMYVSESHKR